MPAVAEEGAAVAGDHEIIVVDNGSTDGSAEAAERIPGVRVIRMGRNAGFAAANNAGIRESRGDLLLLLNSDTLVPPGALDRLVGRLLATDAAAVAGPRLVDAAGRPELSFGRMISPFNEWRQKRRTPAWIEAETAREQFVDWVSGACLLVRRADAEAAGLLDERFFLYTEDVDFCHAIRKRGRKVLFTPAAEITHLRGRSRRHAARSEPQGVPAQPHGVLPEALSLGCPRATFGCRLLRLKGELPKP